MRVIDPKATKGAPGLTVTALSVADIVRATYYDGVPAAAGLAEPPLSPEEVRAAINFCADEACVAHATFCQGCRKRTEAEGIKSLDEFCARFAAIEFEDARLRL